jgi:aspartate ammonia-lyase
VATLLSPVIGYEAAAELVGEALEKGVKVGDLVVEKRILTEEQIDELIEHSCEPNLQIARRIADERRRKG